MDSGPPVRRDRRGSYGAVIGGFISNPLIGAEISAKYKVIQSDFNLDWRVPDPPEAQMTVLGVVRIEEADMVLLGCLSICRISAPADDNSYLPHKKF